MLNLVERQADRIVGVVSCFDRVVITGTLPAICRAKAMEVYLRARSIGCSTIRGGLNLCDELRAHAEKVAQAAAGLSFVARFTLRRRSSGEALLARGDRIPRTTWRVRPPPESRRQLAPISFLPLPGWVRQHDGGWNASLWPAGLFASSDADLEAIDPEPGDSFGCGCDFFGGASEEIRSSP